MPSATVHCGLRIKADSINRECIVYITEEANTIILCDVDWRGVSSPESIGEASEPQPECVVISDLSCA